MTMQTCRFCGSWRDADRMFKYGVRHYAHFDCYLGAGKRLDALSDWQILRFPYQLVKKHGLMSLADAAYARTRALSRNLHNLEIDSDTFDSELAAVDQAMKEG